MKKLITILSALVLMCGCSNEFKNNHITFIETNSYLQGINQAQYYYNATNDFSHDFNDDYFYDSIGKFKVGQKLKLTK